MIDMKTTIIFNRYGMGEAEPELQLKLATTFLQLLLDGDQEPPAAICFYGEGVKLAVDGSPVLEQLKALADRQIPLILCSTCLHFYNLRDKVAVGIVGGMHDIIEAQWRADKVITL